jgi:hypothetical protein
VNGVRRENEDGGLIKRKSNKEEESFPRASACSLVLPFFSLCLSYFLHILTLAFVMPLDFPHVLLFSSALFFIF